MYLAKNSLERPLAEVDTPSRGERLLVAADSTLRTGLPRGRVAALPPEFGLNLG